jgi:exodeoxyribonuclease VII large subunit
MSPRDDGAVLTVSELNALAQEILEGSFPAVWVEGEISNLRRYPSGHTYFTLKDDAAQIAAVLFRGNALSVPFRPKDGLKVLVRGRVSVYAPRGTYQLIVETMQPAGLGALQLAFEQLKARLLAEGLFDAARKRPLPLLPRRVGVVASLSSAALRDILRVLQRRFAGLSVLIAPARVQGEGAAAEIARAIRDLNRDAGVDVLIVARGGGSLEDLWAFNEEVVVRAIAGSSIPVISAVGHEVDVTLADLAADLRAPTPSAAAEMVVSSRQELGDRVAGLRARLEAAASLRVARLRHALVDLGAERALELVRGRIRTAILRSDELAWRLRSHLERRVSRAAHRLELLAERMTPRRLLENLGARRVATGSLGRLLAAAMSVRLEGWRAAVASGGERLLALSPLAVLARGYAICRLAPDGPILKDATTVPAGSAVRIRLHRGSLGCRVTEVDDGDR